MMMIKRFVAYFYWNGFDHVSLGLSIDYCLPNIEVHVPFGFFRVGWVRRWEAPVDLAHMVEIERFFAIAEHNLRPSAYVLKSSNPKGYRGFGIGANL